jgi:hypothetical protein
MDDGYHGLNMSTIASTQTMLSLPEPFYDINKIYSGIFVILLMPSKM